jgi:hypothetical protein
VTAALADVLSLSPSAIPMQSPGKNTVIKPSDQPASSPSMLAHPAVDIMEETIQLKQYFIQPHKKAAEFIIYAGRKQRTRHMSEVVRRQLATQMVTIDSIGHNCFQGWANPNRDSI